jgi:hypothetical protein
MEDSFEYGYPMKAIDRYHNVTPHMTSMMTWATAGLIIGSKDLWSAIDRKIGAFRFSGWEGHMLTHLTSRYMTHLDISRERSLSPFLESRRNVSGISIIKRIEPFMPDNMRPIGDIQEEDDRCLLHLFSIEYWMKLFPTESYPSILVRSPSEIDSISMEDVNSVNIIISVKCERTLDNCLFPMENQDRISVDGIDFEARVILAINTEAEGNKQGTFSATRYMRHGSPVFLSWWKQERGNDSNEISTKCLSSPYFEMATNSQLGFAFVILYVRLKESNHTEEYMLPFHRSIGGQDKAFCQCNDLPLISTGRRGKKNKRKCMTVGCSGLERYICSSFQCNTRICKGCFDKLPTYPYAYFNPPIPEIDVANNRNNDEHNSNGSKCEEDCGGEASLRENVMEQLDEMNEGNPDEIDASDDPFFMDDYLTNSNFNPADTACTNAEAPDPFIPATDSGQFAYDILDKNRTQAVPCHVLLNQVGVLCTRYNQRIYGTYPQQNFIQRIVSTITGHSFPLLYLMATLFPRHFYLGAKHDPLAVLGALPVSCYTS